ncbi:MAG TPA: hypothetical protein VG602_04710 [Actinomycetota bacterium]|nr:hypothetical protein [Actinomycetota bacterium]
MNLLLTRPSQTPTRRVRWIAWLVAAQLLVALSPAGASESVDAEWCELPLNLRTEAPPFGLGPCPGVRPGAFVDIDHQAGCTLNFLFVGTGGTRYMGTAGHCAVDDGQEVVFTSGQAPVAYDSTRRRIGEFAYAVNNDDRDFALIRLDSGVEAKPQMCHFGGPTGLSDPSFTASPDVIQHFGQGLVFGQTVAARSGAGHLSQPGYHFATTAAIFGDSGSGVQLANGSAVGVLVAISPLGIVITRLAPQVERARQMLGLDSLVLQTAPQL